MILIGWAALALENEGDLTVLDSDIQVSQGDDLEALDRRRVQKWLGDNGHIAKEGLAQTWSIF